MFYVEEAKVKMDTVKRAKELIRQSGMSLYQVSQVSGVSYSTFTAATRRGSQLTIDTIERLCVVLGISLSDFFKEQGLLEKPMVMDRNIAAL